MGTDPLHLAAVLGAGLAAGFINSVAGGGSLLTLPALLSLGLPAAAANGTNRVGVLLQSSVASAAFHKKGLLDTRYGLLLTAAAIPGAVAGALLAVEVDEILFRRLLGVVMLLVLAHILRGGRGRTRAGGAPNAAAAAPDTRPRHPALLVAGYVFVGLYAGFIQAGVGFIQLALLTSLGRLTIVKSNAFKVLNDLAMQSVALAVFALSGTVDWAWGSALAAGMMLGSWCGVHWQVRSGEIWVRRFLAACIVGFAAKLLFS